MVKIETRPNILKKKGQVTLFVILALILVGGIILFFVITNEVTDSNSSPKGQIISPESYLIDCIEENVREKIFILGFEGGSLKNVPIIDFEFRDEQKREISYLCYTPENYKNCNVMEPMLMNHLSNEIKDELNKNSLLRTCWDSMKNSYQKEGYEVTGDYMDVEVDLIPDRLIISLLNPSLILAREENSIKIENVVIQLSTKLYDNAFVATEISNQQSKYGSFNELGYMALYPETDIKWTPAPNETKIYTIKNKETSEVFRFAVRSLVPSGNI